MSLTQLGGFVKRAVAVCHRERDWLWTFLTQHFEAENMKKFFTRKTTAQQKTNPRNLQPKYILPAVPRPCPHEFIAIKATQAGLLLRPKSGLDRVIIRWGKAGAIESLPTEDANDEKLWLDAVVAYGIVGILHLNSGDVLLWDSMGPTH